MPKDHSARAAAADVYVIGSANLDLVATTHRLPQPGETVLGDTYREHAGGKGLNQAVAAARAGARTALCAAVGGDDAARQLLEVMAADHIDVTDVQRLVAVPTGRALIGVSADGENSIIVVPGANAALEATHVLAAGSARVVLAQLEVPLATVQAGLAAGRAGGAITILNPAPATPLPADIVGLCDVLIPNEHEVEMLGGLSTLFELGAKAIVVTLGGRGAKLCTRDGGELHVPAFPVTPIDTTGAGDAFCGAFAASLATGAAMADALRFAAAGGALATTRSGAVPSMARRAEIDALVNDAG